jgi:regulator of sigma E protease
MQGVLIFILFLGPLIFFHELGHFLFARLCGVRVETFSIGFGPKLFKYTKGHTTYAFSLIPLGGYVKMFGDEADSEKELTDEEKSVAFNYKTKIQKFWIIFGGPLANFIFAYVIYAMLFMTGQKVPQAKFGLVANATPYYQMGVRTADILFKVNDMEIVSIDDIGMVAEQISSFTVLRGTEQINIPHQTNLSTFIKEFFQHKAELRYPITVDNNGKYFFINYAKNKIDWKLSLEQCLEAKRLEQLFLYPITKLNEKNVISSEIDLLNGVPYKQALADASKKGSEYFYPDMQVSNIVMNSAADKTGLKKDDIIVKVGGKKIASFFKLRTLIQENGDKKAIDLVILRSGKLLNKKLTPIGKTQKEKTYYTIGVYSNAKMMPLLVNSKPKGIFESIALAFPKTWQEGQKVALGFKKLLSNEVSMDNIGGPIAIGKAASDSFNISLSYFFKLMAMISINLGLINLFPIPVLDGGHILFLFLEVLNRGPLSKRKVQLAQQFGVWMLFALIFIALFNDISRLI